MLQKNSQKKEEENKKKRTAFSYVVQIARETRFECSEYVTC
jgi:hypothetical protein